MPQRDPAGDRTPKATVNDVPERPATQDATPPGLRPSKSQRKREMHDRQALGQELAGLSAGQLARLPLSESLVGAIALAQRVTGHEARRRQMQYIGKLMRGADFEAIRAAYEDLMGGSRQAVALMHRCERLRERLVEDDTALGEFVREQPGIDIQWLRAKVRAVRQERAAARPPRHSRELYQWLHARLHEPATDAADAHRVAEIPGAADPGTRAAGKPRA
jgi:ribosome-associated protein